MRLFDPPYALWSIWKELGYLDRLVILIFCVISIYSLFLAISTLLRIRSMRHANTKETATSIRDFVVALGERWSRLRQVIAAAFYLFGVILFIGLQTIGNYVGDGNGATFVLGNFILQCAFAANVFFILLVLHCIEWFICGRLRSLSECAGMVYDLE